MRETWQPDRRHHEGATAPLPQPARATQRSCDSAQGGHLRLPRSIREVLPDGPGITPLGPQAPSFGVHIPSGDPARVDRMPAGIRGGRHREAPANGENSPGRVHQDATGGESGDDQAIGRGPIPRAAASPSASSEADGMRRVLTETTLARTTGASPRSGGGMPNAATPRRARPGRRHPRRLPLAVAAATAASVSSPARCSRSRTTPA